MGLAAAFTAVETLGTSIENSGFVREEAHLAMLVLSDEDDQSTVFGGGVVPSPKNFFSNWALGLKAYPEWVSFSSIVNLPTGCSAYGSPSFNYLSVTNAVGGEFGCISDSDYAPVLTALTDYLEGNGRYVELNYEPVESTIEVKVVDSSGIELVLDPTSWEFLPQSNAVYVSANGAVVELGASVYVTYTPMPI
jgi:hypothetical protein